MAKACRSFEENWSAWSDHCVQTGSGKIREVSRVRETMKVFVIHIRFPGLYLEGYRIF